MDVFHETYRNQTEVEEVSLSGIEAHEPNPDVHHTASTPHLDTSATRTR
jgi:hypothetical protein